MKTKKKLSPEEKARNKEQNDQQNEIRNILKNIGFERLNYIDGKEFIYDGRTSEMDDVFIFENIILITEYTIGNPSNHLAKKNYFYEKVLKDPKIFIEFMINEAKLSSFQKYYDSKIKEKYTLNQLKLEILYCSKKSVNLEHKESLKEIKFFDYNVVQYFKSLTKVIKRSSKYEFLDFLEIPFEQFGENILNSSQSTKNNFHGHILPEEKSSFDAGYQIVSFYIDAESLMKRAYILRQESWRDSSGIGHYQRMFDGKKINAMRKYLSEKQRVYINNIIATLSSEHIKLYDSTENEIIINKDGKFNRLNPTIHVTPTKIEIIDKCNIIGLIDGQHRTYSYHEGDDIYETQIAKKRKVQNLLVTGILFPENEKKENKLKFEATLFLEINSNQTNIKSKLKQEIESMISPFSSIAIAKRILIGLNQNGSLNNLIEQYSFEKGKLKTASVVSFGLRPLIKLDSIKSKDSLFFIWTNPDKNKLLVKNAEEFLLLSEYIDYSVKEINILMSAFKSNLNKSKWNLYSYATPEGILNVTFINGILNVLRLLIENGKVGSFDQYDIKLKQINNFDFKKYKSSQYRKMGIDIYESYMK